MTNLLIVLPDFDVSGYTHILPSLEKALISTADLLTLEAIDVAKRAQVPPGEVKRLSDALIEALLSQTGSTKGSARADDKNDNLNGFDNGNIIAGRWDPISTLDDELDRALGGGIARSRLTEIVGESAAGKTQFLLTLLLSAQLSAGENKSALYISTEAALQTTRLAQILKTHPKLAGLPFSERPSLSRVHSTHLHDVEAQEHILRFQAPVAIQKHNVGLLVIDSIAANYRAEFDKGGKSRKSAEALAKRNTQLVQIGSLLRNLARTHKVAIVVANQVADRFAPIEPALLAPSQSTQSTRPGSPAQLQQLQQSAPQAMPHQQTTSSLLSTDDPLALDHQQRFFTGWGDDPTITSLKTPSLGLTWTNQLACRIALLKDPIYEERMYQSGDEKNLIGWKRACKIVFSSWCAEGKKDFEIWEGGIRSVKCQPPDD